MESRFSNEVDSVSLQRVAAVSSFSREERRL